MSVDVRQERGQELAKRARIKLVAGSVWSVPSATGDGSYGVDFAAGTCTCPDHEVRRVRCKHLWAVEFVTKETLRETVTGSDGTTTVREVVREKRVTYRQNWPAYNTAQTTEKEHVGALLRALCDGIEQPRHTRGRPRLPLADVIHAAAMKTFVMMSGRRASSDVRDAEARGHVAHAPHYNTVFSYLERADVTPLLKTLVEESAAPLKAIETSFAVDATGFATSVYARWFDHRYGREMKEHRWLKCHAMVGTTTQVVTAVEVTVGAANDSPMLPALVKTTAERFDMREVSADKAYLAASNLDAIEAVGAVPYVPFKCNSKGEGPASWRRMWHLFSYQREAFLARYHQRSNVEAAFSMIKRKFGGAVRAKLHTAQVNEVLLKILVHNLSVLVHAIHELGIEPIFWTKQGTAR